MVKECEIIILPVVRVDEPCDPELVKKNERNRRVQLRYDELMREGKHGHYESMFRVVREEIERAANESR